MPGSIQVKDMYHPVWVQTHGRTVPGVSGRWVGEAVWVATDTFVGLVPSADVTPRVTQVTRVTR